MPDALTYLDFDLRLRPAEGGYRAEVLASPAGEAAIAFAAPFSPLELENFLLRIGRPRRGTRRIDSPEMAAAKTLGARLWDAVFNGVVRDCWHGSLSAAEERGRGLRLRLRLGEAPELADIPWEYLYMSAAGRFLSLSQKTPLIRYLDLPQRITPLAVTPPLTILALISTPTDFPALDVEAEWSRLSQALASLVAAGRVRLERLAEARLPALQKKLRRGDTHILHFIGHGGFDRQTEEGVLVLEDEWGRGRLVGAEMLGTILHDHRSLRLAVLNACEGARGARADPLAGVAQTLVRQGIPAVIAMQFEITDAAAILFAEEFYAAVADGYPVDAALAEARKAIFAAGNDMEWGTPVLHLRAPDGQLFALDRNAAPRPAVVRPPDPAPHPVVRGDSPPGFAHASGEDAFGRWAEFSVPDPKGALVTQRLRWIPPGRFLMGSPATEAERYDDEGPQHEVTFAQGFWLFDTACTQALWQAVMGTNPSRFKGADRPVEMVSWEDCGIFIDRINRLRPGLDLVLPSEAQWEYACRAGTSIPFSVGSTITPEQVNYDGNYPYTSGAKGRYRQETVPVASLPPNPWGLYEMHGNVWEWCADHWHDNYQGAPGNGSAWRGAAGRVVRGGSWRSSARFCRSAYRRANVPGYRSGLIGFRCARGQD
jgi:formylglycine-generating enzyme required for sulfatase activity